MLEAFLVIVYLGLATSALSVTLTKADVGKPLRNWFEKRLGPKTFLTCPFCTSYWIAAPLVIVYRPVVIQSFFVFDVLISLLATVAVAAVVSGITIQTIPNLKEKK